MATFTRELGIAFGPQSAEGTADATIAALSGSIDLTDGIVLGDANSGLLGSGITSSFTRRFNEKAVVSGSFTKQASDFLEEQISLEVAFPLAGPRQITGATPSGSDFTHDKGIDALLGACGLIGAVSGSNPTVGWKYSPGDVAIATAKLFDSGFAWVIRDIRGDLSIDMTPGEVAVCTATLSGIVDSAAELTFPTFDYQVQASFSAPAVSGVTPSWGISDTVRGWESLTIGIANSIDEFDNAASSTGKDFEQGGREITVE